MALSSDSSTLSAARAPGGLREVIALAYPVVLTQLSTSAMGVVDSSMVGRLGATQLAAVGFGSIWLWTLFSLLYGTASGVQTFVSQSDGAGRGHLCGWWTWQGFWIVVPATLAVVLLLAPWVETLIDLLGASAELSGSASAYISLRLPGEVGMAIVMIFMSYFRGLGDTRTPLVVLLFANAVNVVLDYGLIFGRLGLPEWGVPGAAAATSVSHWIAACIFLGLFLRRSERRRVHRRWVGPEPDAALRFARVSVPIGGQWCVGMTSFAFFTTLVAHMGDTSMAASQAFVMLLSISFMQAIGISIAASTLVGRYKGAGDTDAANRAYASSIGMGIGMAGLVAILFIAIPGPLLRIFTDDPNVMALGRPLLLIGALFQLFDAIVIITEGALRGAGDTRWPFLVETAFGWGVFVPLAYTLGVVFEGGLSGAWLGGLISLSLSATVLVLRFRSGTWKHLRI